MQHTQHTQHTIAFAPRSCVDHNLETYLSQRVFFSLIDPPLDLIDKFLTRFGHPDGGSIRTDQGREVAGSQKLVDMVLWQYNYVVEPTGADSPSQNGMVEIYNDKLAIHTCTLLYGAGLLAKYWSAVLLHAVYLNNHLIHSVTQRTSFDGFYGRKPDITYLKMFGSQVCVKYMGV
jgi:hypothetical protein